MLRPLPHTFFRVHCILMLACLATALSNNHLHPIQVHVLVSHLKSYTGMGSAQVTCIGGCSCDAVTINATLGFNASLTSFAQMQVTPHPACEMQVGGGEGGWSANGASHHPSNCQPPSRRSRC